MVLPAPLKFRDRKRGPRLAYRHENPQAGGIGLLWLGGLKSDMTGTKAEALAEAARMAARACLRFDYSGHGASKGDFADFTLSDWLADTREMFLNVAWGEQVLIGSSMGGYIALLLARWLAEHAPGELARIRGMVLIAPAADMTEALMWRRFDTSARQKIAQEGRWLMPSAYGEGYVITKRLIEDGRKHLILNQAVHVGYPMRILHGSEDPDVPWQHGFELFNRIVGNDVSFTLIKNGDHRLSTARDIRMILDTIDSVIRATF
jgi:pimeloyl-ACP methyl ester carboxylesterase